MINEFIFQKINFYFDDQSKKDLSDIFSEKSLLNSIDSLNKDEITYKVGVVNKLNFSEFYTSSPDTLFLVLDEGSLLGQMTEVEGDNVFLIDQAIDGPDIEQLVSLFFEPGIIQAKRECIKKGYKKTSSLIKEVQGVKLTASYINELINFEQELYCSLNRSEMINIFFDYLDKNLEGKFCLYRDFEADFNILDEDIYVFSLGDDSYFLSFEKTESNMIFVSLFISSIFHLLSIEDEEGLNENPNIELDWAEVYNLLPIPLVLIDSFGSIRKYNKLFLDLTLTSSQCSSFENNQDVSIKGNVYKIKKVEGIDNEKTLIYFLKDSYIGNKAIEPSNEELGIISSSLAHELNNPLGGILAAISLMELDELTEEVSSQLEEMKKSAKRCKQLVETFLGFSRALPQNYSSAGNILDAETDSKVQKAFAQANDLIRFRLIENNLMMYFTQKEEDRFKKEINPSIWAMIMYLVYGEVITTFQHLQLVDRSYKNLKSINCQLKEKSNEVLLNFDINQVVEELDLDSGLISHLMDNEKISISKVDGALSIKTKDAFLEI